MSQMYRALSADVPQIRLLELEPSDILTSQINGRLRTVNLDEAPKFVALSYVWGDKSEWEIFVINGCTIKANRNLSLALRRIRDGWKSILSHNAFKCSKNALITHWAIVG